MSFQEIAALMTIAVPLLAAIAVFTTGKGRNLQGLIYIAAIVISISSIAMVFGGLNRFTLVFPEFSWIVILGLEILLTGIFLYYAFKLKSIIIAAAAVIEIVFSALSPLNTAPPLAVDSLSMVLILITSLLGSVISIYSLHYMRNDERKREFFTVIFVFIAAMNGAVMANENSWFILFWGVTSLCSFLLIKHPETHEAQKAAKLALTINTAGGAALAVGMYLAVSYYNGASLESFSSASMAVPAIFLVAAAMTKSAQFPVQSWLPGAMAAPVPVSALLHSSTMVNLGIYLLLRISQVFADSPALSAGVAFIGLISFVAAAVLAAAQSNAKRLLAYSTISNLGLIVMCAGIAQPHALMAAIILLIYHALSKALLFLTVGSVKEKTGSEDIEDMRSLSGKSSFLTAALITGIVSITLPPFGMFASKWMIIGAASANPGIIIPLAIGLGVTSLYYFKWVGVIISPTDPAVKDKQPKEYRFSISILLLSIIALSISIIPVAQSIARAASETFELSPDLFTLELSGGLFPLVIILLVSIISFLAFFIPPKGRRIRGYACGETEQYLPAGEYYLSKNYQIIFKKFVYALSIFTFILMVVVGVL